MSKEVPGRGRPDEPSPEDVQREVAELGGLSDREFQEALGDNILRPDPVESAAFRSPQLVVRSFAAVKLLEEKTLSRIGELQERGVDRGDKRFDLIERRPGETEVEHRRRVETETRKRADHFRMLVRQERRILEAVIQGLRAQHGVLPNAPNPRGRALRRLAALHPQEYLRLVREEQEADRVKAKARRKETKDRNRAARAGGSPWRGRESRRSG